MAKAFFHKSEKPTSQSAKLATSNKKRKSKHTLIDEWMKKMCACVHDRIYYNRGLKVKVFQS